MMSTKKILNESNYIFLDSIENVVKTHLCTENIKIYKNNVRIMFGYVYFTSLLG